MPKDWWAPNPVCSKGVRIWIPITDSFTHCFVLLPCRPGLLISLEVGFPWPTSYFDLDDELTQRPPMNRDRRTFDDVEQSDKSIKYFISFSSCISVSFPLLFLWHPDWFWVNSLYKEEIFIMNPKRSTNHKTIRHGSLQVLHTSVSSSLVKFFREMVVIRRAITA